ncbi:MAG: primosomal protein N' [Nitrospinota bacterium]|nr:primosomal protein N' [Nitrospinota bacterium]
MAVPIPVDRTFTYRAPESMRDRGRPRRGERVRVPFGGRVLTGVVVAASDQPGEAKKILDVSSVLDDGLVLSQDVLRLTRWMADYYCAGWGEVLKAALPGGGGQSNAARQRICVLGRLPPQEEIDRALRRSPRQRELLGRVLEAAGQESQIEIVQTGVNLISLPENLRSAPLKALVGRGWLRLQEVAPEDLIPPGMHSPAGSPLTLTAHQERALKAVVAGVESGGFHAFLLRGVTGSGKTEVYLRAIDRVLALGRDVIVLVPEIALTPQLLERFRARFRARFGGRVAELHSGLTVSGRIHQWRRAAAGAASIIVGARSAVFAPVRRLGLIVVDEEHEASYKQEETPRYNARDVAVVRARQAGACAVLGSATPSLESFFNGETEKYERLGLPKRVEDRSLPRVDVVDLRKKSGQASSGAKREGGGFLSGRLIDALAARLDRKEQALLFLNRRGFASCVQCRDCGWAAECPACSVSLTFHLSGRGLRCHYCGHRAQAPEKCPECSGMDLDTKGVGTQRVEDSLRALFPAARVARMDRDTTQSRGAHGRILGAVSRGEIDILVGTQMVAKGHDYPGITLVGVILADATINIPDFRSGERTFQLLTQVSGRAGRGRVPGEVIIQTYRPDHYAVLHAAAHDYEGFVQEELRFRRDLAYPPYTRMVRFRIEGESAEKTEKFAGRLALVLTNVGARLGGVGGPGKGVPEILGPAPGVFGKLQDRFRWQVVLKEASVRKLGRVVSAARRRTEEDLRPPAGVRLGVDVDPMDLY